MGSHFLKELGGSALQLLYRRCDPNFEDFLSFEYALTLFWYLPQKLFVSCSASAVLADCVADSVLSGRINSPDGEHGCRSVGTDSAVSSPGHTRQSKSAMHTSFCT